MKRVRGPSSPVSDVKSYFPRSSTRLKGVKLIFVLNVKYSTNESIIYQDNKAAMLLEKNGKASSGKRTKHINVRYFFVTDRIAKGEVKVEWCPTEDMTGDFWTKPLQGAQFRRFRDLIMGVVPQPDPRSEKTKKKAKE